MLTLAKLFLLIAVVFIMALAVPIAAQATDTFSVTPVLPENQNPESQGSFNLDVRAGQSQVIEVLVANHNDDFITVEVSLITPGTARSGVIDYSKSGDMDVSLETSFLDIAELTVSSTITIPKSSSARVPIALQIPESGFNGVIFGAIHVLLTVSEEEMAQAGQFVHRFAQVIPVRLFNNRAAVIAPDFELGDIGLDLIVGVAAIEAYIRNPMPRFCIGAAVSARIFPAGSDTPIFTATDLEVDFAPHSVYSLTLLDNAGYGIPSGDYVANILIEFGGQIWSLEQNFNISPEISTAVNSNAINQQAPPQQQLDNTQLSSIFLIVITGAVGVVIILCLLITVIVKSSKRRSHPLNSVKKQ